YKLIDSPQVNAFCLPGGKVAVYSGIMPVAKNVNGLAVIMGHEIAHAIARHGAERMAQQKLMQIGQMAVGVSVSDMDINQQRAIMGALGLGAQFGIMLPFSRDHESEADYMGLIYVARACFDPTEAPKLWERMGQASGGRGTAEFMSTHPSHATRIKQFQEWMPEALQIRKEKCGI
ncbi:MAG: M48 family metallopeptidase, partial [Acidobacteria bacterium]|nr:M48 family metallopeptidase [Acidobacteriota bacterium]